MYEFIRDIILPITVICIGLFYVIKPELNVKKNKKDDPSALKKMRIQGVILIIAGIVLFLL